MTVVWSLLLKVLLNHTTTYMYSAVIIHSVGTQQSVTVIHFLQKLVRHSVQLQVHAGGRSSYNHLQLCLIAMWRKQYMEHNYIIGFHKRQQSQSDMFHVASNITHKKRQFRNILRCKMNGKQNLTFSSAMLIPLLNLRVDTKEVRVLVNRTSTLGLVTIVTPPSIVYTSGCNLWWTIENKIMRHISQWN